MNYNILPLVLLLICIFYCGCKRTREAGPDAHASATSGQASVQQGTPSVSNSATNYAISEQQALVIAKKLFEEEFPGTLWSHDVTVLDEPKEPKWIVCFKGVGQLAGPGTLHMVFVNKHSGKARLIPGQ
jgi:hypothetical protein